jgi:predicted Zn-dependent peptidase
VRGMYLCSLLITAVLPIGAQGLRELQTKTNQFTLANGMHFIVIERHDSPVVSFHLVVNAGSINDPAGETGTAHMLERLAYKGTETIGSRSWPEEKKSLDAIEEAYGRLESVANRAKGDQTQVDLARNQVNVAIDNAQRLSAAAEYRRILEENGALELGAQVSDSATQFWYSLPSNRQELWFLMESQRLLHPVFREFYREREASIEEYRQRVEGNPQGKLVAELLATAFHAHPYGRPQTGWPSDTLSLRRSGAQAFFDRYYVPGNMTVAMVGDVTAADARRLADRYFGPIPGKPVQAQRIAQEPPQNGPRSAIVEMAVQPFTLIGYKRPSQYDADDVVLDVLHTILAQGRSGLLYDSLVREKRLAQQVAAQATMPEGRYPNLFVFLLLPAQGRTVEENQRGLDELLQRLKSVPVDAPTLARAKAQGMANLVRRSAGNREMAALLAFQWASYGDLRKLFTYEDELNRVKPEDVQRAASRYFVATGRTTLSTVPPGQSPGQTNAPPPKPAELKSGGGQ